MKGGCVIVHVQTTTWLYVHYIQIPRNNKRMTNFFNETIRNLSICNPTPYNILIVSIIICIVGIVVYFSWK